MQDELGDLGDMGSAPMQFPAQPQNIKRTELDTICYIPPSAAEFATEAYPIRASSLVNLAQCAPSVSLRAAVNESGEAAETGSVIHAGVQAYHQTNSENIALAVMAGSMQKFPRANSAKAKLHVQSYVRRQAKEWGKVIECESKARFTLPPHPLDPTQKEITIIGTRDQLREHADGTLVLVDIKTGAKKPEDLLHFYAPQIAAYQYDTVLKYPGRTVKAAILRTADFIYGGPIFHYARWDQSQLLDILDFIRVEVAQVRAGFRVRRPGTHCNYCPARSIHNCSRGIEVAEAEGDIGMGSGLQDITTLGDL